jgi:hypothetical protein
MANGAKGCADVHSRQIETCLRYLCVEEIVLIRARLQVIAQNEGFNLDGAQSFHQILDTADRRERSSAWFFLTVLWMQLAAVVAIGLLIVASFVR